MAKIYKGDESIGGDEGHVQRRGYVNTGGHRPSSVKYGLLPHLLLIADAWTYSVAYAPALGSIK